MTSRSAFDPSDYANARFLSLTYIPVSEEAHRLKERLYASLFPAVGKRRPGRPPNIEGRGRAAVAILADVLDATSSDRRRWVYRPLSTDSFDREEISYRAFIPSIKAFEAQGFLKRLPGYWDRDGGPFSAEPRGRATRWAASERLFDLCQEEGITPENVTQHFKAAVPTRPLVLRASSVRNGPWKVAGKTVQFPLTERSRSIEAEVHEINRFLHECEIRQVTHRGFRRMFNKGDDPKSYGWNKGGRLYSLGSESYQVQKQAKRGEMTIDGQPVVEIDIRASFLTLYHALLKEPSVALSGDPYAVEGIDRDVIKAWLLIAFGSGKLPKRWSAEAGKDFKKYHTTSLGKAHPIWKVEKAVVRRYPALGHLETSGIDYFDMMFRESEAVIAAMLTLIRDHGVPSLPVHDSLIVPETDSELAKAVFKQAYIDEIGVEPLLTVKGSPQRDTP